MSKFVYVLKIDDDLRAFSSAEKAINFMLDWFGLELLIPADDALASLRSGSCLRAEVKNHDTVFIEKLKIR